MNFHLVGISGAAGAGKGTIAATLVEACGFIELALADPLKGDLAVLFPPEDYPEFALDAQSSRERPPHVRRLQQVYGTEIVRRIEGPLAWVRRLAVRVLEVQADGAPGVVVPDVRFPDDEAAAIQRWGGTLIHVERFGHEEASIRAAHASESHLDPLRELADVLIKNAWSVEDLRLTVRRLAFEKSWTTGRMLCTCERLGPVVGRQVRRADGRCLVHGEPAREGPASASVPLSCSRCGGPLTRPTGSILCCLACDGNKW